MAMTLLTTNTPSGAASSSFTSKINSTYKLYIFKFYGINPVTDGADFTFQANASGESDYNEYMTTTYILAYHNENDSAPNVGYLDANDQAQGTGFQTIANAIGNGADESCAGELHLFNPASTTYVKHFYTRLQGYNKDNYANDMRTAGYFNVTAAITNVQFKMSVGNFDGTIKMYGVG